MYKTDTEHFLYFCSILIAFIFHLSATIPLPINNTYSQIVYYWFSLIIESSLKPIEVFFHEASHALIGMLSGGQFIALTLSWQGSGQVVLEETNIRSMAITAFSGYVGAAVWGFLIYKSSLHSKRYTRAFLFLFCLGFLYKSSNLETLFILLAIMCVFLLAWCFERMGAYLLRFIGIFIIVSAVYSPGYLLRYADVGDHIVMQNLTGVDAIIWITIWTLLASWCLYLAYKEIGQIQNKDEINKES